KPAGARNCDRLRRSSCGDGVWLADPVRAPSNESRYARFALVPPPEGRYGRETSLLSTPFGYEKPSRIGVAPEELWRKLNERCRDRRLARKIGQHTTLGRLPAASQGHRCARPAIWPEAGCCCRTGECERSSSGMDIHTASRSKCRGPLFARRRFCD